MQGKKKYVVSSLEEDMVVVTCELWAIVTHSFFIKKLCISVSNSYWIMLYKYHILAETFLLLLLITVFFCLTKEGNFFDLWTRNFMGGYIVKANKATAIVMCKSESIWHNFSDSAPLDCLI